jgi:RNA polymerase sigma-70 factor (ECF subfamily)
MPKRFQELLDELGSPHTARQAQEALYRLAAEKLLEPIRTRIPQKARRRLDAEDVLHESLLRALRGASRASFSSERQFLAWVYRIARNQMADQAKRMSTQAMPFRHVDTRVGGVARPRESEIPSRARGHATELENREAIEEALRKLPEPEAEVIRRRWLRGQSFDEIAPALQRTRTAIKSLYARAWKRFRDLLKRQRSA